MNARKLATVAVAATAVIATVAVGAAAATGEPAAAQRISVGTHNMHYGDGEFTTFAAVVGWQEVTDPPDQAKLKRQLGSGYQTYFPAAGPAKAVPISWRADRFTKTGQGSVRTHAGEAHVTPARYVNWVILKLKNSDTSIVVVNTHFISGAWSGHPERQARWRHHYDVLRAKVAELHAAHPEMPLFVLGDMNRHLKMSLPPTAFVPVAGGGVPIDQEYVQPAVSHTAVTRLQKWGSDHNAYRMYATL